MASSPGYKDFVKNLKTGDLVLMIDNYYHTCPVVFLNWNGPSATNGYRANYLYIPDWDLDTAFYGKTKEEKEEKVAKWWKECFEGLEKHGSKSTRLHAATVNAQAEKRFFPFPKKFLTERQKKFLKIINKIKGYEY